MGYCVDWDVNITIRKTKVQKALDAINELMKPENVQKNGRGGSWTKGGRTGSWYSWVDNPPNNRYETIKDAFEGWGFDWNWNGEDFLSEGCNNEKLGQEELFLEAIAPYVVPSSYVIVHGEDGASWRWAFKNGHLVEQKGRLTFED